MSGVRSNCSSPARCSSIRSSASRSRNGEPIALTAREFRLLETLMRAPDAVVSREDLMEQAWGEREEPMSNTIDVLIARLRRKMDPDVIETVRGLGYRIQSGR